MPCSRVSIVNFEQVNADWVPTQILMLCSPLGTITNGFNHGVGSPVSSSMIPSFSNRLSSSITLSRKAKGIRRSHWATGVTDGFL